MLKYITLGPPTMAGLADFLKDARETPLGFARDVFFERLTDSLIFYWEDCRSYAKRLNASLTVFLAMTDDRVVGVEIKGFGRKVATEMDEITSHKVNDLNDALLVQALDSPDGKGNACHEYQIRRWVNGCGDQHDDAELPKWQFRSDGVSIGALKQRWMQR